MERKLYIRVLAAALLLLFALVSCFYLGDAASSVDRHDGTLTAIDGQAETVLKLSGASIAASAVISAFPDDTATPIAEKLADFTQYFLLILCVLYAEKYGVTILGFVAFRILIPAACVFLAIWLFRRKPWMRNLARKFVAFALAAYFVIPVGVRVSNMIYKTYETSINNTIAAAQQFAPDTSEPEAEEEKTMGVLDRFLSGVSETVSSLVDRASNTLQRFVETLAIMVVTSCIIPLLVLLFFIWLLKALTGINIPVPAAPLPPRRRGKEGADPAGKAEEPGQD